jgi:ADP-glucose pyrophosphorylase
VGEGALLERVVVANDCVIPPYTVLRADIGAKHGYYVTPKGILLVTEARQSPSPFPIRKIA